MKSGSRTYSVYSRRVQAIRCEGIINLAVVLNRRVEACRLSLDYSVGLKSKKVNQIEL